MIYMINISKISYNLLSNVKRSVCSMMKEKIPSNTSSAPRSSNYTVRKKSKTAQAETHSTCRRLPRTLALSRSCCN